jgi:hypothetical protein
LVTIRSASADQIREQMKMKAEQNQKGGFGSLFGEARSKSRNHESETDVVAEDVVIIASPVQGMGRIPRQTFGYDSESVHVRHNACPSHYRPFAFAERRRAVCNRPTD